MIPTRIQEKHDGLIAWAQARGFVPATAGRTDYWDLAYAGTVGYGYVTIRVSGKGAYGYDIGVLTGHEPNRQAVSLGVCRTLEQLGELVDRLLALDYEHGEYAEQTKAWLRKAGL